MEVNAILDKESRKRDPRPTSLWVALVTFPVNAFFVSTGLGGIWNLFRELYCRAYHESAKVLCHYFDWEFRPDFILIHLGTISLYTLIHFWFLRHLSYRRYFFTLLFCGAGWLSIFIISRLVPGEWDAWY